MAELSPSERIALTQALDEAARFIGATAPNPPVGAAALASDGTLLAVGAHHRAGEPHAEALVLAQCRERGLLDRVHTVVVTLEPCNHVGRTPPCTEAILAARPGVRRLIFGQADPNPRVAGGGAKRLREAGIEVVNLEDCAEPELLARAKELIRPFRHWVLTGRPWVTVKTAHFFRQGPWSDQALRDGSMIPPKGQTTFTSESSLKQAHELRRQADAILTGSGTILSDNPQFTVRNVPDHPGKRRWLVVMDRRGRVPEEWLKQAETRGFRILRESSLAAALDRLGALGCLEVLVEAGPELSRAILTGRECLWNSHVVITRGNPDQIETRRLGQECLPASSKKQP